MHAVIRTGGKQYRVASGDVIAVEKLAGETGGTITFDDVLLISDGKSQTVGSPTVDGASVAGTILEQGLGDKIIVFKKKRRKGYRRTKGHRQPETVVRITDVLPKGKKSAAKKAAPKKAETGADDAKAKKTDTATKTAAKPKAAAEPKKAKETAPSVAKAKSEGPAKTTKAKTAAAKPKTAAKKPAAKKAAPKAESKE